MKIILIQLIRILTSYKSYPIGIPLKYWVGEFNQKFQYEYRQFQTLIAYLFGRDQFIKKQSRKTTYEFIDGSGESL